MKKKKSFRIPWLVIVILLALGIGMLAGYEYYRASQSQSCIIGKGSNVTLDLAMGVSNGQQTRLIYTTSEQIAVKSGIYSPFATYKPVSLIVGNSSFLKAFDENLIGLKKGDTKVFAIPPEKAYGYYNSSLIKIMPLSFFNRVPKPGESFTMGNATGTVKYVNATSAIVDFNSPFAGMALIYRVWIRDVKC